MTRVQKRGGRIAVALVATGLTLLMGFRGDAAGQDTGPTEDAAPSEVPTAALATPPVTPQPAARALDLSTLPIPEGRFLPYVSPCTFDSPHFRVSQTIGIVGEQIGWYALGFRAGSNVTLRLYTVLNEELVEQRSLETDAWCHIMGTFPIRIPDQYFLILTGTTPKGESVTVMETVRGVMDLRAPVPALTPAAAPIAPTGLRASPITADMVRLDWNDNSRNETGFVIDVEGVAGVFKAATAANSTSITIGTLQPSTRHCFWIAAVNDAGQSPRHSTCIVTPREGELGPGR